MRISIHQPNFMPWYPFFKKIESVDTFIILENCQFEKNGYQNRFNIDNKWYTMSVNKGIEPVKNKIYINYLKDWNSIKSKLNNYKTILNQFDECINEKLSITNSSIIKKIANLLQIKTNIIFDYPTELNKTERLVDICKKHGATTYVAGSSGNNYLDINLFKLENINVEFQNLSDEIKKPILYILKGL